VNTKNRQCEPGSKAQNKALGTAPIKKNKNKMFIHAHSYNNSF